MRFSIVVAVYKRADELEELLESLCTQTFKDFETVISDGSPDDALSLLAARYASKLNIQYIYKKGYKASESRNEGCKVAKGDYFIFLDSDVIAPAHYLERVDHFLQSNPVDAFGGPDAAREDFTPVMKAINYAMTSFLTTGGIRGKKKKISKFQLRGFNMGISRDVFTQTGGFSTLQVAEDIELSVRIQKAGYRMSLIEDAFVFHKRKSDLKKFSKQLTMHGRGRVDLNIRHPGQIQWVHLIPSLFLIYSLAIPIAFLLHSFLGKVMAGLLLFYVVLILLHASQLYKSLSLGFLSLYASLIMLYGYGYGLLEHYIYRVLLGKGRDTEKEEILKL